MAATRTVHKYRGVLRGDIKAARVRIQRLKDANNRWLARYPLLPPLFDIGTYTQFVAMNATLDALLAETRVVR
jgi:hypothetical protein